MEILKYPDPRLRRRAAPVKDINSAFEEKVRQMFEVLYKDRGIGLAAPQVGWSERVLILNLECDIDKPELERVLINPRIVRREGKRVAEEGCLSFPGLYFQVERDASIELHAYDLAGDEIVIEADNLLSRAIQHEIDHLDGMLFIDRASLVEKAKIRSRLKSMERAWAKHKKKKQSVGR